jgi:hypothetical protein
LIALAAVAAGLMAWMNAGQRPTRRAEPVPALPDGGYAVEVELAP